MGTVITTFLGSLGRQWSHSLGWLQPISSHVFILFYEIMKDDSNLIVGSLVSMPHMSASRCQVRDPVCLHWSLGSDGLQGWFIFSAGMEDSSASD